MQTGPPDLVVAATQAAEKALRRAAHLGAAAPVRLVACDHVVLDDAPGLTRTTCVWQLPRATWRVVVDSAAVDGGQPSHAVVEVADAAGPGRGARGWDERYAADPGPTEPHVAVVDALGALAPGKALDIACGTGRHSVWLAERGWEVTALDFSRTGIAQLRRAAAARDLSIDAQVADVRAWRPPAEASYDLVLMTFVVLPEVLAEAARWVAPGGHLLLVGPSARTPDGPGPSDPRLRLDRIDVAARVTGSRLRILRASEVEREGPDGPSAEVVLLAVKP